jgi:hypothetical protein
MRSMGSKWLIDGAICVALLVAAVVLRMQGLSELPLHFDAVDPFMRAVAWVTDCDLFLRGEAEEGLAQTLWPASAPWVSQFGPALVWGYAPFVAGASTLHEAFARRYVLQALGVAFVYLSMRVALQPPRQARAPSGVWPARLGAWAAAMAVGFGGEPFGTLGRGDQTYLAPDLCLVVAVAAAMVLVGRRPWWFLVSVGVLPWAIMMHPLAACYVPGVLILAVYVWRLGRKTVAIAGLAVGAVCAIPEFVHLAILARGDPGGGRFSETLGYVSTYFQAPTGILGTAAEAFVTQKPIPLGILLILAPLFVIGWTWIARRSVGQGRSRSGMAFLALWAAAAVLGLLALAFATGLHHGYHWRIPLPALALTLGLAVSLLAARVRFVTDLDPLTRGIGRTALVLALVALSGLAMHARSWRFPLGSGDLELHDWMTRVIQEDAGTSSRWFDAVVLRHDAHPFSWAFTPAIYIEQRLADRPRDVFRPDGSLYLAVNGPTTAIDRVRADMGWGESALRGWAWTGSGAGASGPAVAGRSPATVHLVGRYVINPGYSLLLVRLPEPASSRAWTAWLYNRFPPGTTRLMLDSNHVMPLTVPGLSYKKWWRWFDASMLDLHLETAESGTPEGRTSTATAVAEVAR